MNTGRSNAERQTPNAKRQTPNASLLSGTSLLVLELGFSPLKSSENFAGLVGCQKSAPQFFAAEDAHQNAYQAQVFCVHRFWNPEHQNESDQFIGILHRLSKTAKRHDHLGDGIGSSMRQSNSELQIDLRALVPFPKRPIELLPIHDPGVGSQR